MEAPLTNDVIPGRRNREEESNTLSCFAQLCIQAASAESTAGRYTQPTGNRPDSACMCPPYSLVRRLVLGSIFVGGVSHFGT